MQEIKLPHNHGQNIENLIKELPPAEDFMVASELMRLLGDSSRLRIFWILCHCEECVINLSAMMNMTSPAISHHLNKLRAAGLIVNRREGKEVYYRAANVKKAELLHDMLETLLSLSCPKNK